MQTSQSGMESSYKEIIPLSWSAVGTRRTLGNSSAFSSGLREIGKVCRANDMKYMLRTYTGSHGKREQKGENTREEE